MSEVKNNQYDDDSIEVLEGLEAVRKRPGMYIGSTDNRGLHHLVWEIVDNSIDEVLAGAASQIEVTLEADGSVTVADNGRGVPTGMNAKLKKSTPEVIFSVLHAGGKFGGSGYKTSGGLHGVGSSVVNALSSRFDVKIYRDKKIHEIKFVDGGRVKKPLTQTGTTTKTGTVVNFLPDKKMFSTVRFSFSTIADHLKEAALLNSGLKIILKDEKNNRSETFEYSDGLEEFVKDLAGENEPLTSIIRLQGEDKNIVVDVVFEYTNGYTENVLGFANNVKTPDGGTHLTGFRSGLTRAINDYARKINYLKEKDKNLTSDDLREGLVAVISLKIPENLIQYEGQTKGKLGTSEARSATESIVVQQFGFWLEENKVQSVTIIEKALLARKARDEARKARQAARQAKGKRNTKNQMLGKLTPANGKNRDLAELYLVEGDSAGGSAKKGRDAKFQAILPLRGKVINSEKAKLQDLLKNEEINVIINAIGAGIGADFDVTETNYGKIIIMTDADTDGAHIQILLLTFFYRYMKDLILKRHIFIALPPLYKVKFGDGEIQYFWEEKEFEKWSATNKRKFEMGRYKGLGEMNAEELWDTTMDPKKRKLISVTVDDALASETALKTLMGDDAEKRKAWIEENVEFTLTDDDAELVL